MHLCVHLFAFIFLEEIHVSEIAKNKERNYEFKYIKMKVFKGTKYEFKLFQFIPWYILGIKISLLTQ